MMTRPNKYNKLSEEQLHWAFQKIENYILKYNEVPDRELDDNDWKKIAEEAINFGDVSARQDPFCIQMILNALDYLQYSKHPRDIKC